MSADLMEARFDAWIRWGDRIDLTFDEFQRIAVGVSGLPHPDCPYHGATLGPNCKECHDAKMARQKMIDVKES